MKKDEKNIQEQNQEEVIHIYTDEAEAEADKTRSKADEFKELAQRVQAEFDNYRKRNNESVKNARRDGIDDVLTEFFVVLDNLERGAGAVKDENAKNGMGLIYKQILGIMERHDVTEISALDEDFNPELHHAIAQCEDEERKGKVVEVFQKGYRRKNKVLRAAMVKVAQ